MVRPGRVLVPCQGEGTASHGAVQQGESLGNGRAGPAAAPAAMSRTGLC